MNKTTRDKKVRKLLKNIEFYTKHIYLDSFPNEMKRYVVRNLNRLKMMLMK